LAVVLELFSRKVPGWSIAERMTATVVCDALAMALWRRHLPKGVIVHSDRGSQYCSNAYQALLARHQLICSMSKKGDCYDNAAMESWNHSFKVEAIHGEQFPTRDDAKQHVFDYIEVYYNRKRLHSKQGYSPLMPLNLKMSLSKVSAETGQDQNVFADHGKHFGRCEISETRPAQIVVVALFCILSCREDAPFHRFAEAQCFVFFQGVHFVQTAQKQEVGDLFHYLQRVGDAAGPEGIPDSVALAADFAG